MDIFTEMRANNRQGAQPLAARLRPQTLKDFVGQQHFLGPGKLFRRMLDADRISSVIFYGPPGCGKTALAHVVAKTTKSRFVPLNAVSASIKDVRDVLAVARDKLEHDRVRTILFLDEIHRFTRAQQDGLLPDVEDGTIILIGATTQNPFFSINTPLLSRSQIFTFEALTKDDIAKVITRAITDTEKGLGSRNVTITPDAMAFLCELCEGDARRALTALEIGVMSMPADAPIMFDLALAQDSIQKKVMNFDPTGDSHYDLASAFIKSIRGSDPDAALYWLATMLESGEDPRFIVRRLVILASEDIGNAEPLALLIANAAWDAVERVGLPECQLNLSQAVTFLALSPKSNACTTAIFAARKDVKEGRTLPVPKHLRDKHYSGAKTFGHGEGYQYSHDHPDGWVNQEYVSTEAQYYQPTDRGKEAVLRDRLKELRNRKKPTSN